MLVETLKTILPRKKGGGAIKIKGHFLSEECSLSQVDGPADVNCYIFSATLAILSFIRGKEYPRESCLDDFCRVERLSGK